MATDAPTQDPVKSKNPPLAENADRLNSNVKNLLRGQVTLFPNLSSDGTLTTGHKFDDTSVLSFDINALRDKVTPLTKDPRFGEQAKAILTELMGVEDANGNVVTTGLRQSARDQFTTLVSGVIDKDAGQIVGNDFNQAAWDKKFQNITDSIVLAKQNIDAVPGSPEADDPANDALKAAKDAFKASLDDVTKDVSKIQKESINNEMSRLNGSLQKQLIIQHSDLTCKQMYGNNWERKQFLPIFPPKSSTALPPEPGSQFSMQSKEKVGLGENGFYRQENSDYIVQLKDGVYTASYAPIDQTLSTKLDRMGERFKKWRADDKDDPFTKVNQSYSFAKQYAATVEAILQLSPGIKTIVLNYPAGEELSKIHIANIKDALADAKARIGEARLDDNKRLLGFELGKEAMASLMGPKVSETDRKFILDALADLEHDYKDINRLRGGTPAQEAPVAETPKNDEESVLSNPDATPVISAEAATGGIETDNAVKLEDVDLNINRGDPVQGGIEQNAVPKMPQMLRGGVERVEDEPELEAPELKAPELKAPEPEPAKFEMPTNPHGDVERGVNVERATQVNREVEPEEAKPVVEEPVVEEKEELDDVEPTPHSQQWDPVVERELEDELPLMPRLQEPEPAPVAEQAAVAPVEPAPAAAEPPTKSVGTLAQESFHLTVEIGTMTRNLAGELARIVDPDRDHRTHEEKFENLEQKLEAVDKKLADFEKRFSDFSAEADKHKAQPSASVSSDYLTNKQASLSEKLATAREAVSDYKEKMENLAAQTPSRGPKPSG